MPGTTVGERIVVHLSGFLRHADAFEVPLEMTQDGIGSALGISRAHVALELKRLRVAGKVEERMAHVAAARPTHGRALRSPPPPRSPRC